MYVHTFSPLYVSPAMDYILAAISVYLGKPVDTLCHGDIAQLVPSLCACVQPKSHTPSTSLTSAAVLKHQSTSSEIHRPLPPRPFGAPRYVTSAPDPFQEAEVSQASTMQASATVPSIAAQVRGVPIPDDFWAHVNVGQFAPVLPCLYKIFQAHCLSTHQEYGPHVFNLGHVRDNLHQQCPTALWKGFKANLNSHVYSTYQQVGSDGSGALFLLTPPTSKGPR